MDNGERWGAEERGARTIPPALRATSLYTREALVRREEGGFGVVDKWGEFSTGFYTVFINHKVGIFWEDFSGRVCYDGIARNGK